MAPAPIPRSKGSPSTLPLILGVHPRTESFVEETAALWNAVVSVARGEKSPEWRSVWTRSRPPVSRKFNFPFLRVRTRLRTFLNLMKKEPFSLIPLFCYSVNCFPHPSVEFQTGEMAAIWNSVCHVGRGEKSAERRSLRTAPAGRVAARKRELGGATSEMNAIASRSLDFAKDRRLVREAFSGAQQRLDHFLFKVNHNHMLLDLQNSQKGSHWCFVPLFSIFIFTLDWFMTSLIRMRWKNQSWMNSAVVVFECLLEYKEEFLVLRSWYVENLFGISARRCNFLS